MRHSLIWVLIQLALWCFPLPLYSLATSPPPSLSILKKLIAIDTTNPPGNEIAAAQWAHDYLSEFGIPSKIVESAPGRGNLIAKLPGKNTGKSLVLLAHLDVVTANPTEWTYPPFVPTEANGYLYGRGAIDMKGQAALMMAVFIGLHLEKIPLERDLYLVLVADEEAGGKYGAEYLVEHHLKELDPALVLNEGSIGLNRDGMHLYPIQVAEKGVAWLKVSAVGDSGHGSMPTANNATLRLIQAIDRITAHPQPIQKTPIVAAFLEGISREFSFPKSFLIKNFFSFPVRQLAPLLAGSKLNADKFFNAMVRNTIVPTVLKAGEKTNVIPANAEAEIDCRLLPGVSPEEFIKQLASKIDDSKVQLSFLMKNPANESNFQTQDFAILKKAIQAVDPQAVVVPFISPGATDMRFFRRKGILAYGIIPVLVTQEDLDGLHGKDEKIPLAGLTKGEKILEKFIKDWQQQP